MRRPLIACAGTVPLVLGGGAVTAAPASAGTTDALLQFLTSMKFMMRVEAQDVTADFAVLSVLGPDAAPSSGGGPVRMETGLGADLIVPRADLAAVVAGLRSGGAGLAGMWAYEALRIAAGRPRFGLDTDHRTIPHEVGWIETAVHLNKGCYRGQETVARVHNLGHPPRRLVLLQLDGSEDRLPGHGDPVLLADGIPATQEIVVSPDAGANIQVELKRRRGDLIGRPRQ